jgi:hypothetical protein
MANDKRVRRNFMSGQLTNGFTAADTSITDPSFTKLGLVDSSNHMALTFEDLQSNTYEIVYVLAHALNSPVAVVRRAQEGTTSNNWNVQARWVHSPTARDFIGVGNNDQKQLLSGRSYPTTGFTLVGTRNVTLPAYPGDVIQVSQSATIKWGHFNFDFFTLVGGKQVSQFSKSITSVSASDISQHVPGMFLERQYVFAFSQLDGHDRYHYSVGDDTVNASAFYQVKPSDVLNNTVTVGWYCNARENGNGGTITTPEPFYTTDGMGFVQGTAAKPAGTTIVNQLGVSVWSVQNHGPRLSV